MLKFTHIYIDPLVKDSPLINHVLERVSFEKVIAYSGENHPGDGLLLTHNRGAFVKPCPGQKGSVCCGYWVVEWGMGCPFECEYCIIQNYTRARDLTLFLNWEDCQREIANLRQEIKGPIRLGTGQFGDPLAIEEIFPLNAAIIKWTSMFPGFTVEIKTKSDKIGAVMRADNAKHVTLAFSLNPQEYIDRLEHGAASLVDRLKAAAYAANEKGCSLAFHFDPLLPLESWQKRYEEVFALMYQHLKGLPVKWISLGTFRFPHGFDEYVEKNHPGTGIFAEEFYPSADGKIRYFRPFREEIYRYARASLFRFFPGAAVYMCMETPDVWERLEGKSFLSPDLKKLLDASLKNGAER